VGLVQQRKAALAVDVVVIVCAQATCMHLMHNWSGYTSHSYMKCDGYRLSWACFMAL
jgi:hypothetical protein